MSLEPTFEDRAAQPYAGVRRVVPVDQVGVAIASGLPEVFVWLGQHGIQPSGPPFVRYLTVDMETELELDVCVPVSEPIDSDSTVQAGTLPAGRYATHVHVGAYDELVDANAALQAWAREQNLTFAHDGVNWTGRVEVYVTDPQTELNPANFRTELAYLLAP